MEIAEGQIEGSANLTLQEKEQAIAEFREQFDQQVEHDKALSTVDTDRHCRLAAEYPDNHP